jgi:hypothetical protein
MNKKWRANIYCSAGYSDWREDPLAHADITDDKGIVIDLDDPKNAIIAALAPEMLDTLKAIKQRMDGEFDAPEIRAWGPLLTDRDMQVYEHVAAIVKRAEK